MYGPVGIDFQVGFTINTMEWPCAGDVMAANGQTVSSAAWPSANRAFYFPFCLGHRRTFQTAIWQNGTTASGNIDIGIYTLAGSRLGSLGSTAVGATNTAVSATFGTAITVDPGWYFMAMSCDNATHHIVRGAPNFYSIRCAGVYQEDSAFTLPSSATLAALAVAYIPLFAISELTSP